MRNFTPTSRKLLAGLVTAVAVVAANLLAAESSTPAAPEAVTDIGAPELAEAAWPGADEFVVPVISRSALELPAPPAVDVDAVRREAEAWLGDGVMAAPTSNIEAAAPDLDASDTSLEVRLAVPELVRPELPAPPPIR